MGQPVPVRRAARTPDQLRNMAWIPGGMFWMGSAGFYPKERLVHRPARTFWRRKPAPRIDWARLRVRGAGRQMPPARWSVDPDARELTDRRQRADVCLAGFLHGIVRAW